MIDSAAVKTSAKAATPRKTKARGTPVLKKRKLGDDFEGDEEGTVASGEVKNGEAAGEIKKDDEKGVMSSY